MYKACEWQCLGPTFYFLLLSTHPDHTSMSERNPTPGPSTLRQSTSVPCKRRVSSSHSPQQYPAPISEYTNPPEILPSLTMEIYSHRTTVDEDIAGSDKTNERLTMLGERMLEFVALQTILSRKTYVPVGDMLVRATWHSSSNSRLIGIIFASPKLTGFLHTTG